MRSTLAMFIASLTAIAVANDAAVPTKIDFNRDVRSILSDNCFVCHGPDPSHREAGLRLDLRDEAIDAAAIAPHAPDESSLIERVMSDDDDLQMPPADSNKRLTDRQKEILKRWVEQGAEYQQHWAYEPPVKADIPAGENAVDVLVQRQLKELGLEPAAEADRRTLIRRLYFDVLGLPPTPEEVDAFLNDSSPDAYHRLVERALQNPHYGERMAIPWLDVVRYADTIGYHSDTPRNVWPYRDWVIRSFNENKPFDRFTIEQVAGDLLPDADVQTRVGSAFNRLLLTTEEGGAQAKDYEARMVTDRVRAIGAAWLGQTTGCAQCHDHKFDPITMRDFYSLGAFFADIQEPILGRREEGMAIMTTEQETELARLDAELNQAKAHWELFSTQLDIAQQQWEADVVSYKVTLPELRKNADPKVSAAEKKKVQQVADALIKSGADRTAQQRDAIRSYFRDSVNKLFPEARETLAKAERDRNAYHASLPKCLVSVSGTTKRTVRILPRGDWMDESGEVMKPALPHYLPQPSGTKDRELTRLDLAQWLVTRDNPLTARTVMNRLWKQYFGLGLSRVLDDLGAQGEPPVNAELLDWLACEFMDSGWDVKHMVRVIVTSHTYKQSSIPTAQGLESDPENRWLARQSAFRIDAELVRDFAMSVSGLLVPTIGGPSVKPYQPDGYWENLNFPPRQYEADTGENQYRRGLYTWWQRSFLHPSMVAFDAPSREECAAERNLSNIPQQALVLLNDPTYVEAARSFAVRIVRDADGSPEQRIVWAWQQALQREPRAEEMKVARELWEKHLATYKQDAAAAEALLQVGLAPVPEGLDPVEVAAWTHVARVLLNLHEAITRS
jgi:hypothetical protein